MGIFVEVKMKRCSKCKIIKPINEFYKTRRAKDGFHSACKICMNKDQRARLEQKNPNAKKILSYSQKHRTVQGTIEKLCTRCSMWKPLDKYRAGLRCKDGLTSWCKECEDKQHKKYQQTHKIKRAKSREKYRQTLIGYLRECFDAIKQRCNNPKILNYKYYGKRGIECRFENANDFICYVMGILGFNTIEKIRGLEIDRINNNGHYEMGNIQFVTHKVNCNNRRDNVR